MKKYLLLALRILIPVAGVVYIAYALDWRDHGDKQGIFTTMRQADMGLLLLGLALTALLYPLLTLRWWVLMRGRGLDVTLWNAFRLSMVGCFFNFCMPVGTTGGDLVKAFYAAKGSGRKADAVISILVDRVIGLLGLVLLAGIMSLFTRGTSDVTRQVSTYIGALIVLGAVGACLYFSSAVRRLIRFETLITKLPGGKLLAIIDQAALAYRNHLGAVAASTAVSLILHVTLASIAALAAYALGADVPFLVLLSVLPVLFICAAIPISPQGIGTTEALAALMLVKPGLMTMNQVVGMLMIWRLYQVFYAAFGALFLIRGDIRMHPEKLEEGGEGRTQNALVDG